ncbi:MAG: hypothetical protein IKS99_05520 [Firmicutes bacterium]|nr:hypothetical protein [Bacillota bacterium]
MAKELTLKSKALNIFDYKTVDIDRFIPEFTPDEEAMKKDIERIFKAFGKKEEGEYVEEGDMIVITCRSEIPKFNKNNITVPVGKGLFSKELEEKLLGVKAGEAFITKVDGKEVTGTVDRIVRIILPELTDENVAALRMEGITTVTDLKRYCCDKQIDRLLDDMESCDQASAVVWQALNDNSEFDLDEEEYKHAMEAADAKIAEMKSMKPVFESPEEEEAYYAEFQEEYGEAREEIDMDEMIRGMFTMELKLGAMGYEEAVKRGKVLTEDDYEAYINSIKAYYPGVTLDELKTINTVEIFAKERYNDNICKDLDEYVHSRFRDKMNPYR